jgi:hypothetical protein
VFGLDEPVGLGITLWLVGYVVWLVLHPTGTQKHLPVRATLTTPTPAAHASFSAARAAMNDQVSRFIPSERYSWLSEEIWQQTCADVDLSLRRSLG